MMLLLNHRVLQLYIVPKLNNIYAIRSLIMQAVGMSVDLLLEVQIYLHADNKKAQKRAFLLSVKITLAGSASTLLILMGRAIIL